MSYKIHLICILCNGYQLEFESAKALDCLKVSLTELSFYSATIEDDCVIEVEDTHMAFVVKKMGPD